MSYINDYQVSIAAFSSVSTASVNMSLVAQTGRTAYVSGFSVTSSNATSTSTSIITLNPIQGAGQGSVITLTWAWTKPFANSTNTFTQTFNPGLPVANSGTSPFLNVAADANAANVWANLWGYMI